MNKVKVLIVDDDPGIRIVIPKMLAALGPTVLTAESFAQALEIMKQEPPPDFIFMDLGLPDTGSKEETLHRLEEIKQFNPHAPVIVFTGDPDTDNKLAQISKTVGADSFKRKTEMASSRDLWVAMKEAIAVHVSHGATPTEAMTKIMKAIGDKMIEASLHA